MQLHLRPLRILLLPPALPPGQLGQTHPARMLLLWVSHALQVVARVFLEVVFDPHGHL